MALVQTPYFHIECNGPSPTPFQAHCGNAVEGGWEQEAVEATAAAEKWTKEGRGWFCPKHRPAAKAAKQA